MFCTSLGRYRIVLIACFALTGCDNAQQLLNDAQEQAENLTTPSAPPPVDTPAATPNPADVMAVTPAPVTTTSPTATPGTSPMPAIPMGVESDEALIAQWNSIKSHDRTDRAILQLLKASRESLQEITAIEFQGAGPGLTLVGIEALQQLPSLESLNFTLYPLDAPKLAAIGELTELEVLIMNSSGITDAMLPPLEKLKNLRELELNKTFITDAGLTSIHNHTEIRKLRLNDTSITGAALIKARYLPVLQHLEVERSGFAARGFEAIKNTPNLEYFNVVDTNTSDQHLKALSGHKNLREIWLNRNRQISDQGFSLLNGNPLVEVIDIRGTQVSGRGLAHLRTAKKLTALYTHESNVDEVARQQLRKALPNCRIE